MLDDKRLSFARIIAPCALFLACGGTSKHSDNDPAAEAGMSGSGAVGGTGGTGGTGAGGASGSGGTGLGGSGGSSAGGSGGTAAGGGGQSGGGSGGDAGGGVCETGRACPAEGMTCTLPEECCPCVLTCEAGVWGNAFCPPCPLVCPPLPATGDPCSTCEVPSSCEWDSRPVDGPVWVGRCVDGTWLVEPQGEMPTCCTSDAECAPNVCVNGNCLNQIEGICWRDDGCESGEICSGASACGCDVVCGGQNEVGICVPDGMGCCRDDGDCDAGQLCASGTCHDRSPDGCWRNSECPMPGQICWVTNVCPCGMTCETPDQPGQCLTPL